MYCPQCGKQISDDSRFCYQCGARITIPKEPAAEMPRPEPQKPAPLAQEPKRRSEPRVVKRTELKKEPELHYTPLVNGEPVSTAEEEPYVPFISREREQETVNRAFSSRHFAADEDTFDEFDDPSEHVSRKFGYMEDAEADKARYERPVRRYEDEKAVRDTLDIPYEDEEEQRGSARPERKRSRVPADDLPYEDEEDAFDSFETQHEDGAFDNDGYEEPPKGSALMRFAPMLGMTVLLILIIAVGVGYMNTDGGKALLVKLGVSNDAQSYVTQAKKAYENKDFAGAGAYLEKALTLESGSYANAYNAAVAYFQANNVSKTTEMAKRAIAIDPEKADPYIILQRLYSDAGTRPDEITQLLQEGYQRTGDARILGMTDAQ